MLLYYPTVDKLLAQTYAIKVSTAAPQLCEHSLCLPWSSFLFAGIQKLVSLSNDPVFSVFGIKKIGVALVCLFVSVILSYFRSTVCSELKLFK